MTPDEYMTSRVDEQLAYYSRRAGENQRGFRRLRVIEIVAAALVPVLSAYAAASLSIRIAVAVLGAAIAVIAALLGLYQFQENWARYRMTCEALQREKLLYATKTTPYDVSDPFPLFVQRVEGLLSSENSAWAQAARGAAKAQQPALEPQLNER